ncbi:MAG: HD domain-containing protein [Candidatus Woesearchaeota archaeon]|jgi:uncharacterized protein
MEIILDVRKEIEKTFSYENSAHDFEHTLRVYGLCEHIGKIEKADMKVLLLSALLHDISRHEQDKSKGKVCHAELGAVKAREILIGKKVSTSIIDAVCHCISTHRFRKNNIPISKEAKILFDADKLDGIGAVGIGRSFMFAQSVGATLHNDKSVDILKTSDYGKDDTAYREYMVKLRHVKDRMLTKEGLRMAIERSKFMDLFFDRLNKEVDGEL